MLEERFKVFFTQNMDEPESYIVDDDTSNVEGEHLAGWVTYIIDYLMNQKEYTLKRIAGETKLSYKTIRLLKAQKVIPSEKTFGKLLKLYCTLLI